MKVFIINAVYGIGSTGRSYKELHDFLVSRGHECEVFYGEKKVTDKGTHYMGSWFTHKVHALLSRITGKNGCFSNFATKKIIKYIKKSKPDVVHLGNLHGNFISIPMLLEFLSENDIATVVTLHDCYFYTGGCTHYTMNRCMKWQSSCQNCKYYKNMNSWFFDKTHFMIEYKAKYFQKIRRLGVIGVSEWITSEARRSLVFKNTKMITKIHDWVDLDAFKPKISLIKEKHSVREKYVVLGVASNWGASKGLPQFIELAEKLGDEYRVILIGRMNPSTVLPGNIIVIPHTNDREELCEYYSGSDVFVQFSKEETFGKVVAEALACGTPAVVYRSTASPELVEGGCGVSVPVKASIDEYAEAVKEVCKNSSMYAEACRARATALFEKNKNCGEIERLYRTLAEG